MGKGLVAILGQLSFLKFSLRKKTGFSNAKPQNIKIFLVIVCPRIVPVANPLLPFLMAITPIIKEAMNGLGLAQVLSMGRHH